MNAHTQSPDGKQEQSEVRLTGASANGTGAVLQSRMQSAANGSRHVRNLLVFQRMANQATAQLASYGNGNITYTTENFTYEDELAKRERVSKVVIAGRDKKNSDDPSTAYSFYNEDLKSYEDMEGFHKGHVAARDFGGSSSGYNIVPMLPNFNTGEWKGIESTIDGYIGKKTITIEPQYKDKDDVRVPSSIKVKIPGVMDDDVLHDVPEREGFGKKEMTFFKNTAKNVDNEEYALKQLDTAYKMGSIPSNYQKSPYLPLDIAWLSGKAGFGNPGTRKSYESWQTDWLIRYNRAQNGGEILSDAWTNKTNEPHQYLYEAGRKSRPEADHIVPESHGGSNLFTNARLVSWELNNSIERVVSADRKYMRW